MIGRLSGTIEHREADGSVVVDVNGVGYEVFLPLGAAGRAGSEPGATVSLHIHTHVREDAMTLFGFATAEDRAAFRALLKVSSIGPKLALAIIGVMNAAELQDAIARQDKTAPVSARGRSSEFSWTWKASSTLPRAGRQGFGSGRFRTQRARRETRSLVPWCNWDTSEVRRRPQSEAPAALRATTTSKGCCVLHCRHCHD